MDKRYYIVQVNNGSEAFQSPFIAPGTFMLEERNSGSKFVRYMHPPHSEEDILFINELVNTYSCAPDNWPIFLAEVRGVADNYDNARILLESLTKKRSSQCILSKLSNSPPPKRHASTPISHSKHYDQKSHSTDMFNLVYSVSDFTKQIDNNQEIATDTFPIQESETEYFAVDCDIDTETEYSRTVSTQTIGLSIDERRILRKIEEMMQKQFSEFKEYIDERITLEQTRYIDDHTEQVKVFSIRKKSFSDFISKYTQYKFPIRTIEEFNKFLNDLEDQTNSLKEDFKRNLLYNVDHTSDLTENLTRLMKKMLSKEVLKDYTVQRLKPGKLIFKDTALYPVLKNTLIQVHNSHLTGDKKIEEKNVLAALGAVFNNAKDWEGGRAARFKKNKDVTARIEKSENNKNSYNLDVTEDEHNIETMEDSHDLETSEINEAVV